jgi:hypothetical protein
VSDLGLWQRVDEVLRESMSTELSGSKTDGANDYTAPAPAPCEGCGGAAHGSVGIGILCLVQALRAVRAERDALLREVRAGRELRAAVARLPFDPGSQRSVRPLPRMP